MMRKRDFFIEFKLKRSVAEELLALYEGHLALYEYTDVHEQLLTEHIKDMYLRLKRLVHQMRMTGTLGLTSSEAIAFCQTWETTDLTRWPVAHVLVTDMMDKIDKRVERPRLVS